MSRRTGVLLAVTFLLFFFLLQDLRRPPARNTGKSRFLYNVEPDAVKEISVFKKGNLYVAGTRLDEETWVLTHPVETRASAYAFAPILNFIAYAKYLMVISKEGVPRFDPADYGLEKPAITVLFTAEGKRYGFDVSPVLENKLFIRKHGEEDRVYAVAPHFYNFFNQDVSDYRPRTVFSFSDTSVARIEVNGRGRRLVIEKPPRHIWKITHPFTWPGAPDIIADYLNRIKSLRIKKFEKDGAGADVLKRYGIEDSSPFLSVTLRDGTVQKIRVGRKEEKNQVYYFTDGEGRSVYTVSSYTVDALFNVDLKLFRYRNLAVFSNEDICKIVVDDFVVKPARRIVLERPRVSAPWKCTEPKDERVGTERINGFIKKFIETKIINFTMEGRDKIAVFDLNDPDIIISFFTPAKGGGARRLYRLHLKNKGGLIYGYIDGEPYKSVAILRIPSELFTELATGLAAFKTLYILRGAEDNITWFAVSGPGRTRFECTLTPENEWKVVEPAGGILNMREFHETLDVLADLKTTRIVTLAATGSARYGFDNPKAVVSFVAFGRRYDLLIGKTVPGTTDSYVKVEGSKIVYALARDRVNALTKDTGLFVKKKEEK